MSDQQDKNKRESDSAQKKRAKKADGPEASASGLDAPAVDAPGVDAPGVDAPGVDAPGVDTPADSASAQGTVKRDRSVADTPQTKSGQSNRQQQAAVPDPIDTSSRQADPTDRQPAASAKGGSSAPGWIALLLVLALAGAAAWSFREIQARYTDIENQLKSLDRAEKQEVSAADLAKLDSEMQNKLSTALTKIQTVSTDAEQQSKQVAQSIQALQTKVAEQQYELAQYNSNDREAWLLAEVQYLLRLANQRLVMGKDIAAALTLLTSADGILSQMDDVTLHDVRAAIASDLAALRAVPKVDVEGMYLRLSALSEQAGKLVIFQLPEVDTQAPTGTGDDWRSRLKQGWQAAIAKVSDYIRFSRRDVPMQALMDPQWEGLVKQNLRMLFEQAQVALLSDNQQLYQESLKRSQHWVAEFFESDGAAARAMSSEISNLEKIDISVELPDISDSVKALDDVMQQRLQSGGAQ
ncbi:MAG: uroporphyrinogen-III C-methyltransferase [Pseudomonadota bacterium]